MKEEKFFHDPLAWEVACHLLVDTGIVDQCQANAASSVLDLANAGFSNRWSICEPQRLIVDNSSGLTIHGDLRKRNCEGEYLFMATIHWPDSRGWADITFGAYEIGHEPAITFTIRFEKGEATLRSIEADFQDKEKRWAINALKYEYFERNHTLLVWDWKPIFEKAVQEGDETAELAAKFLEP